MDKETLEPTLHLFKVVRAYMYLLFDPRACLRHGEYGNFCHHCLMNAQDRAEKKARKKLRLFEKRSVKGFAYSDFLDGL